MRSGSVAYGDLPQRRADASGDCGTQRGAGVLSASRAELVAVASTVATDAHNRYLITYTPNNQRQDGAWRQVSVAVPSGYTARTRAGYYAPAPPPIRPSLEFTVMDASSRSYVDVTAEDVDVFEDGVGQVVDTFQQAINPARSC